MSSKRFLTNAGIFTGIFAVSFGAAFFSQYKTAAKAETPTQTSEDPTTLPETDQQKVLNSLLDIQGFEVDAEMTMLAKDDTKVGVAINAQGDLSDLEDIKLKGELDVNLNDSHLYANFGYFDSEIYLDYNNSYFKLETSKLLDFFKMLPTNYNMNVELPVEIENLDLAVVEEYFDNMSEKQLTPDGNNYYFSLDLSDKVTLYIITDLDFNFTGIRTDTIDYNGMIFKFDVSLRKLSSVNLVSPKYLPDYEKYQDFSPALKLFDGIYALTQEKKNTINADLKIRKYEDEEQEGKDFLKTNLDITYNLEGENKLFALDGKIIGNKADENNNYVEVPYSFAIYEGSLYAHYGDIAITAQTDSVSNLIQFIIDKIGEEKIGNLINGLVEQLSASDVSSAVANLDNLLGTIVLTPDELGINLNTSNFSTTKIDEESGETVDDLKLTDMYIAIRFNSSTGALESISIMNFGIKNFEADLVLTFDGYKEFSLDSVNYQEIDHLFAIANLYDVYKDLTKFRIEFDGVVSKDDEVIDGVNTSYSDIEIDGGLQFELDPERDQPEHINIGYGYGDLAITDRKNVKHNIKADMKNVNEILLSYSTVTGTSRDANVDPMNVKFKIQTLKDLTNVISTLVQNPDDHMNEIMGYIFDETATLPIMDIMAGDYTELLTTNLINRFEAGEDYIELDIALDILSLTDTYFTLRVEFGTDEYGICSLKALKISNFSFKGLNVSFNAYLKEFDDSLESTRLSPAVKYIDFSDLKVLLELGINTSKNNYYHFTANANVKISLISKDIDLPIDIKVWTDHGDVKVSVDIDVPNVKILGISMNGKSSTSDRHAHIYYHDKLFYVHRTETYTSGLIKKTTHYVEHQAKYDLDMFLDNIIEILLGDVVCLNDSLMSQVTAAIDKSQGKSEDYQMKYENILNDFLYSKSGHYFWFDINLAEITNNNQLSNLSVKVFTDDSDTNLQGLSVNLSVTLMKVLGASISIKLAVNLDLADCSLVADSSNNLVALDAFEELMRYRAIGYKNTTDTTL